MIWSARHADSELFHTCHWTSNKSQRLATSQPTRRGLSLIEVVVAIGIMGLLMALLLPAVQSSRETARQVACSSQLRQLALAFANYDATSGAFPGGSWARQLRPFLEQPPGYEAVPLLACPSDLQHANGDRLAARISYLLSDGLGHGFNNGVLSHGVQPLTYRDVVDGASQTACFAERLSLPWFAPSVVDWDQHGHLWNRVVRRVFVNTADLDEFVEQCTIHAGRPQASYFLPVSYNHLMQPNGNSCEVFPQGIFPIVGFRRAVTASSPHSGGTQVAMLDGAVHFVSEQIDLAVWRAIGTRNGQEVQANDFF